MVLDEASFGDPPAEYRGVTLWMLNDLLEPEELRRQIRGFKEAGWGAVITRTFNGLRTEYLGEEWMRAVRVIIEEAERLGLGVWLQAGYMPNGIPELEECFEYPALTAVRGRDELEPVDHVVSEDEALVYVERRLEHVLNLLDPEAVRAYLRQAYEETWLRRFGRHFGRTVEAVWVDEPCLQPGRLPWGERVREAFSSRWGYELRPHIACLFRRVGRWRAVRHHYWRTVLDLLIAGYFQPVSKWCEDHGVLFAGHLMGEDTLRTQVAYTVSAMPEYPFMGVPGIDHLTGGLRWWHGHARGDEGHLFVQTPKQCSSAAHQHAQEQVLAEMYGVSTQGLTFADRKRIGEWFLQLGINQRCLHGSYYSLRGRRKRIYPPHLSHQQPWWPENRIVGDYFARLSYALRQGRFRADVLVLHPVESALCVYEPLHDPRRDGEEGEAEMAALNDRFATLSENLLAIQRGFEYGDERTLAERGRVRDGALEVGPMRYRAVILPGLLTLRRTTVELLEELLEQGGFVLRAGEASERVDGTDDQRATALSERIEAVENQPEALRKALDRVLPTRFEVGAAGRPAKDILVHERELSNATLLYLLNTGEGEPLDVVVPVPGAATVEQWDPMTGEVAGLPLRMTDGTTEVELSFAPWQSHLLVLGEGGSAGRPARVRRERGQTLALPEEWQVRRRDPNALTLDRCRLRRADGPWTDPVPVIAVQQILQEEEPYEGPIAMRFHFEVDEVPPQVSLVVEDFPEWSVLVNGRAVSYDGSPWWVDRSFLPTDVTGMVEPGDNTVELRRSFRPLSRPAFGHAARFANIEGVEVEAIYLVGDFGVFGRRSEREQRPKCVRYEPVFRVGRERARTEGDLLADGYPFYAGCVSLIGTVGLPSLPAEGWRAMLCLGGLDACVADVRVNGRAAGPLAWPPLEVDVTDLVCEGENRVELELTNTLRNLLGPHHRPAGEPDHCWGEVAFSGRWSRESGEGYERWWEGPDRETSAWTDDYFFVPFGLTEGAQVRIYSEAEQ